MKLLRTTDRPEQQYTLAFVGYGDERERAVLELTYNYGVDRYDLGTAFGHVAIAVDDAKAACDAVRAKGGAVTRERARSRAARRSSRSSRTPTATRSSSSRGVELASGRADVRCAPPLTFRASRFGGIGGRHARARAIARVNPPASRSSRRSCANASGPWPWLDVQPQPSLRIEHEHARRVVHRVAVRRGCRAASGR